MKATIIHNPRCSKSRETLALLQTKGVDPEVRLYLENPLSAEEVRGILVALDCSTRELLRTSEQVYKDLNLNDTSLSDDTLIKSMCEHPKLIQRPVVVVGDKAKIGRPPESVLALF